MGFFTPDKQNTQTTNAPWKSQQPYLRSLFGEARNLYNNWNPQYYGGSTVAPFSKQQKQYFSAGMNLAQNGNPLMKQAQKYTSGALAGKYSGDPYSSKVYQNIENKVLPSVNSAFSASGRYGSTANQTAAAGALGDSFAPYASQMYQQGLDRQQQAVGDAFKFQDNDFRNLGLMKDIGGQVQQQGQNELNDATKRWDFYQQLPLQKLQNYGQMIQGNYGGVTNTPTYTPSTFSQLLGGGLGIAGLLGGGLFGAPSPGLY